PCPPGRARGEMALPVSARGGSSVPLAFPRFVRRNPPLRGLRRGSPAASLHAPAAAGIFRRMSEVTHILSALEQGDTHAAAQLLPLVYDELRKLAAHKLAQEKAGQTLQATALVHEAYMRLVG